MEYQRDSDGNVTNPPTDPDFERRLQVAHNNADQRAIQRIMDEYADWREQRIKDDESDDDTPLPEQNITARRGSDSAAPPASSEPAPVEDVPVHDTAVSDEPQQQPTEGV